MAILQAHNLLFSSSSTRRRFHVRSHSPSDLGATTRISLPKLQAMINLHEMSIREEKMATFNNQEPHTMKTSNKDENLIISKLYAIAETVGDNAEMHAIIGEQRNNWNILLLNSINSITLTASIMAGFSSIPITPHLLAFKLSSALLFAAATGMMLIVNKIQPSQLAEEQRNASRLFRQLEKSIHTTLSRRSPTNTDVEEAMERVLALEKAYPLSLLPGMLEKFPETVVPTVWWPKPNQRRCHLHQQQKRSVERNGWSEELEEEMMGVLNVLKRKDTEEYVRSGRLVLKINKIFAVLGPLLSGLAAIGAGLIGTRVLGSWPVLVGVVGGALATVVNTLEHGGQIGMVFELFRNCAGFYRQLEEVIEANLGEKEVEKRENGELFEMKVALQLGRSISELKGFASYSSSAYRDGREDIAEFAGKLF